jgi:hypothetical protein
MNELQMIRYENYEKMYQAVVLGLADVTKRMAQLNQQGKSKSVAYRQLMTQKLTYKNILDMYRLFGID